MDGARTHGPAPSGLAEPVLTGLALVLAAEVLAPVLGFLLIGLAVAGGVLAIGFIGYVVAACRRYQQQGAWLDAGSHGWPVVPDDPPRQVNADPVPLRQAITELQAQLLAARGGLPVTDGSRHQHLHFHGLTPAQAAAIITELQAQHLAGWQDVGSQ